VVCEGEEIVHRALYALKIKGGSPKQLGLPPTIKNELQSALRFFLSGVNVNVFILCQGNRSCPVPEERKDE
jgi:hypothetical protein